MSPLTRIVIAAVGAGLPTLTVLVSLLINNQRLTDFEKHVDQRFEDRSVVPDSFCGSRKRRLYEEAQQQKDAAIALQVKIEIDYDEYRRDSTARFIREVLPTDEY